MDKFLDVFDKPKLKQENINHLNRTVTSNEVEEIIVSQQRQAQNPIDSLSNST
jgi:hypothetical protein